MKWKELGCGGRRQPIDLVPGVAAFAVCALDAPAGRPQRIGKAEESVPICEKDRIADAAAPGDEVEGSRIAAACGPSAIAMNRHAGGRLQADQIDQRLAE